MEKKIKQLVTKSLQVMKKYSLPIVFVVVIAIFSYLTFITVFVIEDTDLKLKGVDRVNEINNIKFDKTTLDKLYNTQELSKVEGKTGKNPFMPY